MDDPLFQLLPSMITLTSQQQLSLLVNISCREKCVFFLADLRNDHKLNMVLITYYNKNKLFFTT